MPTESSADSTMSPQSIDITVKLWGATGVELSTWSCNTDGLGGSTCKATLVPQGLPEPSQGLLLGVLILAILAYRRIRRVACEAELYGPVGEKLE